MRKSKGYPDGIMKKEKDCEIQYKKEGQVFEAR